MDDAASLGGGCSSRSGGEVQAGPDGSGPSAADRGLAPRTYRATGAPHGRTGGTRPELKLCSPERAATTRLSREVALGRRTSSRSPTKQRGSHGASLAAAEQPEGVGRLVVVGGGRRGARGLDGCPPAGGD